VIDAASARIQVGVFAADATARWAVSDEEAGVGIFHGVESLGVNPDGMRAFVFCEGPGSVLGIRTAAMALRTWCALAPRPVFAYTSLALVAANLGRPQVSVIADARRDAWHHFVSGGTLRRIATAELNGELVMPEHFRHWSQLPPAVQRVPYTLAEMLPQVIDAELFHATDAPDAFLHEEPSYATWAPQVHRAPTHP
jgi:tRNA threonylcarbamoyladenosine biosynthesis protein TsaB